MKRIIIMCSLLLAIVGVNAQQPGGRPMGGMRPGGQGGGDRPQGEMPQRQNSEDEKFMIEKLPDIPGLTLEQKLDLGNILSKEQQAVSVQMKKKMELIQISGNPETLSDKDRAKVQKKMEKIDNKISKINEKYNKKVKKILSDEQYRIYIEKKKDARFRQERPKNGERRPRNGERPEGGQPPMGGMDDDF